jgi:hypothetical protein
MRQVVKLLSLEPLGEHYYLQPGEECHLLFVGPVSESNVIKFADGYVAVYAWIDGDVAVFHNGNHAAGSFPPDWPQRAVVEYRAWAEGQEHVQ